MNGSVTANTLVGRQHEFTALEAHFHAACAREGSVVLLAGESGIGKTRLAEELAVTAADQGAQVRWGRCYEGEGAPPLWPWIQALRQLVAARDPAALRAELGPRLSDLAQILPGLHETSGAPAGRLGAEGGPTRHQLFESITAVLHWCAAEETLVIIIDDLHLADASSLQLLQFVAATLSEARILIVACYRDTAAAGDPLLTDTFVAVMRTPDCERLYLRGLDEREVGSLLEAVLGSKPEPRLIAEVSSETDGNPFFVTEIARLIADGRYACEPAFPGERRFAIPPTVRDAINQRLSRLSACCLQTLSLAAVIGREFGLALLEKVSNLEEEDLWPAIEEAERARLIVELPGVVGRYRFAHALLRETLYEALPASRRMRLHRDVGEALEQFQGWRRDSHFPDLARHFVQAASVGGSEKAILYASRAAEEAASVSAYAEAIYWYERALEIHELRGGGNAEERHALLLRLGEAQSRAGATQAARRAFGQVATSARLRADADSLADAALGMVQVSLALGGTVDTALVDTLEEALALANVETSVVARLLSGLARALYFAPASEERRTELCARALAIAERLADRDTLAEALNDRQFALWRPERAAERLAEATRVTALAATSRNPRLVEEAHLMYVVGLLEAGAIAGLEGELQAHGRLVQDRPVPYHAWLELSFRAMLALFHGRFEDSGRLLQETFALGQNWEPDHALQFFGIQLFALRREQGRLGELEWPVAGLVQQHSTLPCWRAALAFLYRDLEQEEEARREFETLAADNFGGLPHDHNWLVAMSLLAEVCAYLGDVERARLLYDLLLPYAGQNIVIGYAIVCNGSTSQYLGLLAMTISRYAEAEQHFENALALNRKMEAWPHLARAQYDYASMLATRSRPGDIARADVLLNQALASAEQLGMPLLRERARRLQDQIATRESHVAPRDASILGIAGRLTEREIEVLRLLGTGRSNPEIAAELVLSVHTVERHVANIYNKLGLPGRAEAIAFALRHGLD